MFVCGWSIRASAPKQGPVTQSTACRSGTTVANLFEGAPSRRGTIDAVFDTHVVEIVATAINPRDDVLDVKCGQRRIFLSQLTILALIPARSRTRARSAGLIIYGLVRAIRRACR